MTGFHPEKKFSRSEICRIREILIQENIDILHLFNSRAIINGIRDAKGLPVHLLIVDRNSDIKSNFKDNMN